MSKPELPPFARSVRDRLGGRLPGADAQMKLSPRGRPNRNEVGDMPCREAGVLALLHPATDGDSVVLIERPGHLSKHAGQIAFPGGKREQGESRIQAAIRETQEEIGTDPSRIEVLGGLTPLYIPPSGFCVYPYVAWTAAQPEFVLDPGEVAGAFSVPLSAFVDRAAEVVEMPSIRRRVPAFVVDGRIIWGATAMMLAELATLCEPILPNGH